MYENLLKQVAYDFEMELDDLCFLVSTTDFDFPFSFFAFETEDVLGLLVTDENGAEKIHMIVKSKIVYLKIHYLDELEFLYDFDEKDKEHDKSYI
jgi:hypothetical protein